MIPKFLLDPEKLTLYMFNVGQGDHLLLKLPNNEYGIIDFYYEKKLKQNEPPALSYFKKLRHFNPEIQIVIAFIYISHPDKDHIYGLDIFLNDLKHLNIKVKNVFWFGGLNISKLSNNLKMIINSSEMKKGHKEGKIFENKVAKPYRKNLSSLENYIIESKKKSYFVETIITSIQYLYGKNSDVDVFSLAPLPQYIADFTEKIVKQDIEEYLSDDNTRIRINANLVSSVLMIKYGKHQLLFGADTHKTIWKECIRVFNNLGLEAPFPSFKSHFIKASHHGSSNSSSKEIWETIIAEEKSPIHIGISAGFQYPHPHEDTLKDIKLVKKENRDIKIDATNMCLSCLNLKEYETINLDWLFSPEDHPSIDIKNDEPFSSTCRKLDYDENYILGSYIYVFDKDNQTINASIGITKYLSDTKRRKYCSICKLDNISQCRYINFL